jgi:hypothetical protein
MTIFYTIEEIKSLRQQGQIVTLRDTGEVFLLAGRKSRRLGTLIF